MGYRIDLTLPLAHEIRRILGEELGGAAAELRERTRSRDDAVHEARKHLKKARALLRLVRPFLGASFAWENDVCRGAAHLLATARDAAAMEETVDRLRDASANPGAWEMLRAKIHDRALCRAMTPAEEEPVLAAIEERLRGVDVRLRSWRELPASPSDLAPGAARVIASGRKRYRAAVRRGDPDSVHAWRKRAKDLWYHARLLRALGPLVEGLEASVERLAEVLGQRHDLDVLESLLGSEPELLEESDPLFVGGAIASQRARLDEEAAVLGEMIYGGGAPALEALLQGPLSPLRGSSSTSGSNPPG